MKESYLPLYRKYRPQKLEDVVGQSHIKTALTNAIKLGKISHAYLFTGPRGTGKTSTARILAKSLNCVNGPTIEPCGECESCKAVTNSVPIDVIEIDAASNRSVEDAHNILEKVQYAPVHGKYKIYIIDEVHMLTTQAFNALLKTLEEPPKNVVFILATTESHKVLDTIKSRCQRFDFKRITTNDIVEHLVKIAKLEKINISESALTMIAKLSAGGMRDSLALLDQLSALGGDKQLTEKDINKLLGKLSFEELLSLSDSIICSKPLDAIDTLDKIYNDGNEPIVILNDLLLFFKNLLIALITDSEKAIELTSLSNEQVQSLSEYKDKIETHQIVSIINKISDYIKEIKLTNYQQMWMEIAIIDLANLANNTKLEELQNRLLLLEQGITVPQNQPQINVPVSSKREVSDKNLLELKSVENVDNSSLSAVKTPVSKEISSDILDLWSQILSNISDIPSRTWLKKQATPAEITKDKVLLVIQKSDWVDRFNQSERRKIVIDAASVVLGNPNIQVMARTPLKNETKVVPTESVLPQKKLSQPLDAVQDVSQDEIDEVNDSILNNQKDVPENVRSDQSEMVKQLFDGKYIV